MVIVRGSARKIPEWKKREAKLLTKLLKEYRVVAIADLTKLPSAQLQEIRKTLRNKVYMRVTKNTLMSKAIDEVLNVRKNIAKLKSYLKGSNIFLFTNMNPFELYMLLEKYKIPAYAKPGDIAEKEIVIPAGNTGIPPGPIFSVFGKLKIPTKVQEGTIWVTKDTVVAKPGDKISTELASLLQKLEIMPMEIGLRLKVVYEDGIILEPKDLKINIEEYKEKIREAFMNAYKLGVEVAFPEKEIIELTLLKAQLNALALAIETEFIVPETLPYMLSKAMLLANILASNIASKAPELELGATAKPKEEEKEEEKGKEEEVEKEEELAAGLEALFG